MATVTIPAGSSIQGAVSANPTGTVFLLSGTYSGQSVTPKGGQVFDGQGSAILDGGSQVAAFKGSASGVTLKNMTVQNYQSATGHSALQCEAMPNLTVDNLIAQFNRSIGLDFGDGAKILNSKLIKNGQAGHGGGGRGFLMQNCQIDGNNTRHVNVEDEGGGGKCTEDCTGSLISHCQYSNNYGVGAWADESAKGLTYEYVEAWGNGRAGIMLEISKNIVVRYCTVWGNMTLPKGQFWDCEILLASVTDCDIHHNKVDGRSIIVVDQGRAPYNPTTRNKIHDNETTLRNPAAKVGAWTDVDGNINAVAAGNVFSNNKYHAVSLSTKFWDFHDTDRTLAATIAAGYELGSTVDTTLPAVPVPGDDTPPPPPLGVGSAVVASGVAAVYSAVPTNSLQPSGAAGQIVAGPVDAAGSRWWQVDFGTGVDGWVAETSLKSA